MLKVFPLMSMIVLLSLLNSCGLIQNDNDNDNDNDNKKDVVGKRPEEKPLALTINLKNKTVYLRKKSLGKDFLLRTNMITSGISPQFSGLKSRVVYFEKKQDKLFMFERSKGHQNYDELKPSLILTSYPIKSETAKIVEFDFTRGSTELLTLADWYAQDYNGDKHASFEERFHGLPLRNAYLDKIYQDRKSSEGVQINLKAQVVSANHSFVKTPVELRFFLEEYHSNPNFNPSESHKTKDDSGYFEIEPTINHKQKHVTYATKFDISKPIIFAISHNTPKEYRESVREGILYWNKAFGKKVIQVIDAPEGEEAPNYKFNIVQWIHWKDAGYAYADAQSDPTTGEILNAQVYLTSSFAIGSRKKIKRAMRDVSKKISKLAIAKDDFENVNNIKSLDNLVTNRVNGKKKKHLEHKHNCQHHLSDGFASAYQEMVDNNVSEEKILKVSQHYIRETVAHEIGHVLGLRHNFSGALHSELNLAEKKENFRSILKDDTLVHRKAITSSVMDYLVFEESVTSGYQVKKKKKAFDYDAKAIQKLYYNKNANPEVKAPLFCTDSHTYKYVDCKRFYFGKDPFTHTKASLESNFKALPSYLASHVYNTMKRSSRPDMASRSILSDSYLFNMSFYLLRPIVSSLHSLQDFSDSLQSKVSFGNQLPWANMGNNKELHQNWVMNNIMKKEGGLESLLSFEKIFASTAD